MTREERVWYSKQALERAAGNTEKKEKKDKKGVDKVKRMW